MNRITFNKDTFFVAVLIVSAFFVIWPLLKPGFFITDDGEWMVIRLSAFFQTLREGQLPVRFISRLNNNYGYPVSNFLYPGFLYFGSILHAIGLSFLASVKVIFIASVLGGTLSTYAWLRFYFTRQASSIGALGFLFAPYLSYDIYTRGSLGEVLAIGTSAFGLYAIASRKRWLIPYVIAFLIVSHNTLGFIFCTLLFSYICVVKAKELIVPFFIGVGMAIFFWFPALYERRFVIFDYINVSEPSRFFIGFNQFWLVGVSTVMGLMVVCLHPINKLFILRRYFIFLCVFSLFFASPFSNVFWSHEAMRSFIQFPFRMLAISIVAGAWIIAHSIETMKTQKKYFLIALYILFWVVTLSWQQKSLSFVRRPDGYYSTNEATTTVQDEYMPKWATQKVDHRAYKRVELYAGSGSIIKEPSSSQNISFDVKVDRESVVQINSLYYPGWGASIDNQVTPINFQNANGLMRILVPPGTHHIVVSFRETVFRFICNVLSVVFFLVSVAYVYINMKKKNYKKTLL